MTLARSIARGLDLVFISSSFIRSARIEIRDMGVEAANEHSSLDKFGLYSIATAAEGVRLATYYLIIT